MPAPEPASPSDELANLVLALLAPMFLWATAGDLRLAYTAAAHTVNEYRIANRLSLFSVAKIIAFDIATLSSLSQSMYEDVSILLALRLRGNANSLDRSGERSRLLLEQERRTGAVSTTSVEADIAEAQRMVREANARIRAAAQAPESKQPAPATEPAAPPAPAPEPPAAPAAERPDPAGQPRAPRADAMPAVARALTAELTRLSQDDRWRDIAPSKPAAEPTAAAPPPIGAMAAVNMPPTADRPAPR